ncbi:hypothetical protein [Muribacter muris]|nr:hypothetical protein [Muribacter muris]
MLELMNKHPKINRFIWFISSSAIVLILIYILPTLIEAIIKWQQLTGK